MFLVLTVSLTLISAVAPRRRPCRRRDGDEIFLILTRLESELRLSPSPEGLSLYLQQLAKQLRSRGDWYPMAPSMVMLSVLIEEEEPSVFLFSECWFC